MKKFFKNKGKIKTFANKQKFTNAPQHVSINGNFLKLREMILDGSSDLWCDYIVQSCL